MNTQAWLAIHEAGHAVVADSLGVPVNRAHVTEDEGRCFLALPDDTHAVLNWDMAITVAGAIAVAIATRKDWKSIDLRAVLEREGRDKDLRSGCDTAGFAFRKTTVMHEHDGEDWPKAVASAIKWAEEELAFAGALAADILERRWDDVCEFAERLVGDFFVRETLQELSDGQADLEAAARARSVNQKKDEPDG
jgi:hypothetical protein